jgi:hypothetical protein
MSRQPSPLLEMHHSKLREYHYRGYGFGHSQIHRRVIEMAVFIHSRLFRVRVVSCSSRALSSHSAFPGSNKQAHKASSKFWRMMQIA